MVIQITERDLILKKDGSWSTNKLVVLSECAGHVTSHDLIVMSQVQFILRTIWLKLAPVRIVSYTTYMYVACILFKTL